MQTRLYKMRRASKACFATAEGEKTAMISIPFERKPVITLTSRWRHERLT
jgi:hypothetical protein